MRTAAHAYAGSSALSLTLYISMQVSTREKEEELRKMQEKYGVDGEQHAREQPQGKRG